ncbi:Puromycin-sensitive aminopeptidase [Taenia solium]|eukprot:TsM_000337300 transcript=TsM_000337300 gene=TsM_000337300
MPARELSVATNFAHSDSSLPEIARVVVPTPEGCSEPPDGHNYVKITFDRTPVMATYIIAMVLGDFEYISTTLPNNTISSVCSAISLPKRIEIRVYAPLGKRNFGQHALAVAKKSLAFYVELFQCPYALPKLHLVAIPDFDCSAMENWGLMTFR